MMVTLNSLDILLMSKGHSFIGNLGKRKKFIVTLSRDSETLQMVTVVIEDMLWTHTGQFQILDSTVGSNEKYGVCLFFPFWQRVWL